ncbi:MAG: hypothetical protein IJD01_02600 [Clostridia bacterium]|nr:hypothetical protein [Clostridia bacterium]
MTENAMREAFLCRTLPQAILRDPAPFYEAFEESEDAMAAYMTSLWESLCKASDEELSEHPCFPEMDPYVLEDTEEGFCALVTVTLPARGGASAVTGVVVFGSAMDPRVFAAVPTSLPKGETLKIVECREESLREIAVLYQGCDNGMQLFEAPNPQKRDETCPLLEARRPAAIIDAVVCWCMEHD